MSSERQDIYKKWKADYDAWIASGLTQEEFCKEKDYCLTTFYHRRIRLQEFGMLKPHELSSANLKLIATLFGRILKEKRREKGFSVNTLAEKVNISPQQLKKFENYGKPPDVETILRLCALLGISIPLSRKPSTTLGQVIRKKRIEKGLSLQDLSKRAGFTKQHLFNLENYTQKPTYATLSKVAQALDIPLKELIPEAPDDTGSVPEKPLSGFGQRLRAERLKKGLSLQKLGNKVRVSRQYLSYLENNISVPTPQMLFKLANALDIPLETLLDDPSSTE